MLRVARQRLRGLASPTVTLLLTAYAVSPTYPNCDLAKALGWAMTLDVCLSRSILT